jgi:hypothetical protein
MAADAAVPHTLVSRIEQDSKNRISIVYHDRHLSLDSHVILKRICPNERIIAEPTGEPKR